MHMGMRELLRVMEVVHLGHDGDVCKTPYVYETKNVELYIETWWILWHDNYTSIKLFQIIKFKKKPCNVDKTLY